MTEADWLTSTDVARMLAAVSGREVGGLHDPSTRLSDRKRRLFMVACCRAMWEIFAGPGREAVCAAERYADGTATEAELLRADQMADQAVYGMRAGARQSAAWAAALVSHRDLEHQSTRNTPDKAAALYLREADQPAALQAALLRDVAGNPFRPVPPLDHDLPDWCRIVGLAEQAYHDRDFALLPILADALEEAGCTEETLLRHLRGPGPHARGCWALDLVLGKE